MLVVRIGCVNLNMCPYFSTLVLLAVLGVLIYAFLIWNFGYWKRRGIKEAKSWPFVGSFPSLFTQKRNMIYDAHDLYCQYKDDEYFVGVFSCRTPQLLVLNAEYAHKIFVNDFKHFHDNEFSNFINEKGDSLIANNPFVLRGEEWKDRRAEITPGLTASRVSAVYPVTLKVCAAFADYIKAQTNSATAEPLNAKELCLRYTTDVVSDCVLGIKADSFADKPTPIYAMTKQMFEQSSFFIIYTAIANIWPQIRKFYVARFFSKEVEAFFVQLMQTSIDLRRKFRNNERTDFLNYILQLQDKHHLSTFELTAHTMTFLTDGFETTAAVIAHTLLLLARYPETQKKVRDEVGEAELTYEQLHELPYLDACIHESIRIFSPLLIARKVCTQSYEFINKNGRPLQLEKGTVVLVPVHSLQHDPAFYEHPEEFRPERFLSNESGGVRSYRERGVYFGFGDGPRICLGMRFALTQAKAAIVEVVRRFDITVNTKKTRDDNQLDDTYFMAYLKGGIWLDFEERK